ncbi:MAG: M48 family metallopeptidase [Gemmatimonas sp.]|jgi:Zn-dependent protease with chaperone function|uniref:M48 family metallopeptidase n=1 Tax=Gemmatimonas sp. TaxID=1962908 RepID=UPI00391F1430
MATPLTQISAVSWEHPADRAALRALRAIPGFDDVVRKIAGAFGERGVRNLFLGDAVLVGPTQRPRLHALYQEVLRALDWPGHGQPAPQLYVAQNPIANAGAVGFDQPFIVINSGTLELLDPEEQRFVLAQQLGHIMTGRTTYRTIALIVLFFGMGALPLLASIALLPFQLALLEWYRTSELSADRAGMLGTQDPRASLMAFLKLAGGKADGDQIDLDAYLAQAAEYEMGGSAWDSVLKALNTALREHPFHTVRVAELRRWEQSGAYATIVGGDYIRRGSEAERPFRDDLRDATDYYKEKAKEAADAVGGVINRAADAFREAFKAAASMGDAPGGPSAPPPPPPPPSEQPPAPEPPRPPEAPPGL